MAVTSDDIWNALAYKYWSQPGWEILGEVPITDTEGIKYGKAVYAEFNRVQQERYAGPRGYDEPTTPEWTAAFDATRNLPAQVRYIDALAFKGPYRVAFEIKISRGDFKRDTLDKRRAWMEAAHQFAYVAPKGLITKEELPQGCGLLEFTEMAPEVLNVWERAHGCTGQLQWRVNAPKRKDLPKELNQYFVQYFAGRASRAEHALRQHTRMERNRHTPTTPM